MFNSLLSRERGKVSAHNLFNAATGSEYFLQRLRLENKLLVHDGCVNTICWNDAGTLILSGSDDQHLAITNPFSSKIHTKFRSGHRSNIFSAKFLPGSSDREVVSCSGSGEIFYTDVDREDMYGSNRFDCHFGTTYELLVVPNEAATFLSCGDDGTVRFFDLRTKTHCSKFNCEEDVLIHLRGAVTSIAVDPIIPFQLAVAASDGIVRLYDRRMLKNRDSDANESLICRLSSPMQNKEKRFYRITSLKYRPGSHDILVNYSSENIYLFNTYLGELAQKSFSVSDLGGTTSKPLATPGTSGGVAEAVGSSNDSDGGGSPDNGSDSESAYKPIKRLRLRGDWSDTGPDARPESEEPALSNTIMQRMSDLLTRMLNSRTDREGEGSTEERQEEDPQDTDSSSNHPPQPQMDQPPTREGTASAVGSIDATDALRSVILSSTPQAHRVSNQLQQSDSRHSISSEGLVSPELSSLDYESGNQPEPVGDDSESLQATGQKEEEKEDRTCLNQSESKVKQKVEDVNNSFPQRSRGDSKNIGATQNSSAVSVETGSIDDQSQAVQNKNLEEKTLSCGIENDVEKNFTPGRQEGFKKDDKLSPEKSEIDQDNKFSQQLHSSQQHQRHFTTVDDSNIDRNNSVLESQHLSQPTPNRDMLPNKSSENTLPITSPPTDRDQSSTLDETSQPPTINLDTTPSLTSPKPEERAPPIGPYPPSLSTSSYASGSSSCSMASLFSATPSFTEATFAIAESNRATVHSDTTLWDIPDISSIRTMDSITSGSHPLKGPILSSEKYQDSYSTRSSVDSVGTLPEDPSQKINQVSSSQPSTQKELSETKSSQGGSRPSIVVSGENNELIEKSPTKYNDDSNLTFGCESPDGELSSQEDDDTIVGDSQSKGAQARKKKGKGKGVGKSSQKAATQQKTFTPYNSGKMQMTSDPVASNQSKGHQDVGQSDVTMGDLSSATQSSGTSKDPTPGFRSQATDRHRRSGYSLPPTGNFQLDDDEDDEEEDDNHNSDSSKRKSKQSSAARKIQEVFRRKREAKALAAKMASLPEPKMIMKYSGHRNCRTMIKEANFYGDKYIMSGSDCGRILAWERETGKLVMYMDADRHVVNCIQPHPYFPVLASSGIDYDVKIWTPSHEDSQFDPDRAEQIVRRNQLMLEETRDTVTVPAAFMLRFLASISQIRNERNNRRRASDDPDQEEEQI